MILEHSKKDLKDFDNIIKDPNIKIYYMAQVHDKICKSLWQIYLERHPTIIPNLKPTLRQKQLNEAIFELTGIEHLELATFKKVRGNSDIVLKILLALKSIGISYEEIFFDSTIIKTCKKLITA